MNWLLLIWSASLGASLTLGLMHGLVWFRSGWSRVAHLAFAFAALGVAGVAVGELLCTDARSPAEFGRIQKWMHVPLMVMVAGLVCFISLYFRTGRRWLAWSTLASRLGALVVNFLSPVNLHYREIGAIARVEFFGQTVSVADRTVFNPWCWLPVLSSLLLVVFVADASLQLWRQGGADARRRAAVIGLSTIAFVMLATGHALLVHTQQIQSPYLVSLFFLAIIVALAHELSLDVIAAARLSKDMKESQDQMTLAASAARMALWTWDVVNNRIWMAPEGRALFGFDARETISLERFLTAVHTDDREAVRQGIDRTLVGGEGPARDYRIVLPDGQVRWISAVRKIENDASGRPVRMRGVSMDTTDRHDAEERSQLMVEAAPYAMVMVDAEGHIVMTNSQVEVVFGFTRAELLGKPLEMLIPDRFREVHADHVRSYAASPIVRQLGRGRDVAGRRADGTSFAAEIGLSPVRSGPQTYVLASILDVTEQRAAERQLAEQRSQLVHLARISSLGQLSGALAHELNQPLGIILSNAQAAQRLMDNAAIDVQELKEILADIISEDRRAGEVIKRLRSLLKRGEARLEVVSVNGVIQDVLRLTHSDLLVRGVEIRTELGDGLPAVQGDGVQLQQVLLNLILNGCDAMEALPAHERLLRIATWTEGMVVRLAVTDVGCGLPEGEADRVFQPFFTTKPQGLGIGLAITRAIVEAHRGRLWTEANPGAGTVFHLELPVFLSPAP